MIYEIGYAGRKFSDFLKILKQNKIKVLADVRRFPSSKYAGFNREELEEKLPKHGIRYVWISELGGFRRGYEKFMQSEEFKKGIKKLKEEVKKGNVCIMCREKDAKSCHRRHIIRALNERVKSLK